MKLKIQRTDCILELGGKMSMDEQFETLGEDGGTIYDMAIAILQRFPRFKEIIINTELTEDGKDNH
jgi:hypothetical protein